MDKIAASSMDALGTARRTHQHRPLRAANKANATTNHQISDNAVSMLPHGDTPFEHNSFKEKLFANFLCFLFDFNKTLQLFAL